MPRYMYMELFTAVLGRLRDVTVNVRKHALKLLQQLVYTWAIIFDVKVGEGEQFVDSETVLHQYEAVEKQYIKAKEDHDALEITFNQEKQKIMLDYPDVDSAELQVIMSQN